MLKISTKHSLKTVFWLGIEVLMLLSALFQIDSLQILDEVVGMLSFFLIGWVIIKDRKVSLSLAKLVVLLIILVLIGLLSACASKKYYKFIYVIEGMFQFLKPFLIFTAAYLSFYSSRCIDTVFNFSVKFVKIMTVIMFLAMVYGYFTDNSIMIKHSAWVPFSQFGYYVFYSKYPAFLAVIIGAFLMILKAENQNKNNLPYIGMNCIMLVATQSGTGILMLIIFIVFFIMKNDYKIKTWQIVIIGFLCIIAAVGEIQTYLLDDTAARSRLLRYAFVTAVRYFPLGSGFSTFGSATAAKHYSQLYYDYGFQHMWGLSSNGNDGVDFLNDSYYPMIIGELGFIGLTIFIIFMTLLFLKFNNVPKGSSERYSLLFGLLTLMIIGFSQGGLSSIIGAVYMIVFALLSCRAERSKYVWN